MSKREKHNKKVKYGKMEIRKYKKGGNHPHVIVKKNGKVITSVGLQSTNKTGHHKLKQVFESNGDISYMRPSATRDVKNNYNSKPEKWHIDVESELRAINIVKNSKKK